MLRKRLEINPGQWQDRAISHVSGRNPTERGSPQSQQQDHLHLIQLSARIHDYRLRAIGRNGVFKPKLEQ